MSVAVPAVADVVEAKVMQRTGRRLRGLSVAVSGPNVVLSGQADSFHTKQLALHAVREVVPAARVRNGIEVDY